MIHGDLNSVLIEGTILELREKDFIIKSFRHIEDEDGLTGKIENHFHISLNGKSIPIEREMKVRIVGRLECLKGDEKMIIVPDHIECSE